MQTDDSAVDSFVERCRESLEKQEQNIEAFQNLKKEAEQVSAKSETGQAVQDAREEYFSDGLAVMEDMKKTLEFYIAQNDAFQPLMGAMATDNSEIQQYLQTVYDSARQVKTELSGVGNTVLSVRCLASLCGIHGSSVKVHGIPVPGTCVFGCAAAVFSQPAHQPHGAGGGCSLRRPFLTL